MNKKVAEGELLHKRFSSEALDGLFLGDMKWVDSREWSGYGKWDPGPMVLLLYEIEGSVERIGYLDFRKTVRSIRDLSYNAGEFDGESGGWCSELAKSQV